MTQYDNISLRLQNNLFLKPFAFLHASNLPIYRSNLTTTVLGSLGFQQHPFRAPRFHAHPLILAFSLSK